MDDKRTCAFKAPPKKITVGDRLILSCEGSRPLLLKDGLKIKFPKKEDSRRLVILKTLHAEDIYADLEVASYRPGPFQGSFRVTDGKRGFDVEDFAFSVESVLPQGAELTKKPHGPFGPWREPFPSWYLPAWGLAIFLGAVFGALILSRFFKRKRFIEKIKSRAKGARPSKLFVRSLRRRQKIGAPAALEDLEALFKTFLENLCFIPAQSRPPRQILSSLKKYRPALYKSHGPAILQILNEFECFRSKPAPEIAGQLEKSCRQMAFRLEDWVKRPTEAKKRKIL